MSYHDMYDISDIILGAPLPVELTQPCSADAAPSTSSSASTSASSSTLIASASASDPPSTLCKRRACELSDLLPSAHDKKVSKISSVECTPTPPQTSLPAAVPPASPDPDEPFVIAHSSPYQRCFAMRGLGYGVQFEIARLVSQGHLEYNHILVADLDKLKGSNKEAVPKVAQVLLKVAADQREAEIHKTVFAKEMSAKSPWAELDREEEALNGNPFAGLGFSIPNSDWYGGKVEFRAKLKEVEPNCKKPQYKVALEQPELGHSTRFSRRFGSKSFLKIKIAKQILNRKSHHLVEFFTRPFILCGHVFRGFTSKDNNVFLVRTNEVFDGVRISTPPQSPCLSLVEFLEWHNPLRYNVNQTMAKWAARFALGLSNSVPLLPLEVHAIEKEPDIISSSNSDMTDGAGYVNKIVLLTLRTRLDLVTFPTGLQCRFDGWKGMFVLHPDPNENIQEQPKIYVRPSQVKIQYPPGQEPDPARLIVDLLRPSILRTPGRVSAETMICLSENNVPHTIFIKLLQDGLDQLVSGFVQWEGKDAMRNLWAHVASTGSVIASRIAREASGEARARGYGDREAEDLELDDEDGLRPLDTALRQHSSAWWADQVSGCPSTLEETVLVLLDSGFTPQNCAVLREKLKQVLTSNIGTYVRRYKIDVPMSCVAFLLPDPFKVLAPGEVHIKSSSRNFKTVEGFNTDIILGDVLLTRNPCKVATDVRKFKAVERPELRHYTDVIICSVQGDRRLADLLAGGDYDGDTGLAIWQPEIVEPFRNADLKYSVEPPEVARCFNRKNEQVPDFLQRMESESPSTMRRALQEVLLEPLRNNTMAGMYSTFQDNAIYTLGYCHPEAVRLGYMFCKVLDGAKTGLTVTREAFERDRAQYQKRSPRWKETDEDRERLQKSESNDSNLRRPPTLGVFIMDTIAYQAKLECGRRTREVEKQFNLQSGRDPIDQDITAPWFRAKKIAERCAVEEGSNRMLEDLAKIEKHVEAMYAQHRQQLRASSGSPDVAIRRDKAAFTDLPIEARQDKFRALSRSFVSAPRTDEVFMDDWQITRLRASCAYWYDSQQAKWSRFPWDVAMRELCAIKANALGTSKTVTADFYERFSLKLNRRK